MNFKELIKAIRFDLKNGEKITLKFIISSFLFDLSFRLLLNYRIGKYLNNSKWKIVRLIAIRFKNKQLTKRNCQISFNATIGKGVKFAHPMGIVIGDGVVIKDDVTIWQQVTLGSHGKKGQVLGYPIIENNTKIFAGAKIFGRITIGKRAIIGANAVVLKNVPDECTAVGIPAQIIHLKNI
jgi:serine O-acetyltransferase